MGVNHPEFVIAEGVTAGEQEAKARALASALEAIEEIAA